MAVVKDKEQETRNSPVVRPPRQSAGGGNRPAEREQRENAVVRIVRETRSELRKVVWPSREETIRLTIVVIAISTLIGLILFVGDSIFLALYTLLVQAVS